MTASFLIAAFLIGAGFGSVLTDAGQIVAAATAPADGQSGPLNFNDAMKTAAKYGAKQFTGSPANSQNWVDAIEMLTSAAADGYLKEWIAEANDRA
jgi:hypothetical protein